ncbi:MAG: hypothetical protein ACLURV_05945 [Gallintestinimicrobium sp.]
MNSNFHLKYVNLAPADRRLPRPSGDPAELAPALQMRRSYDYANGCS